jgi:hypothetical protein
MQRIPAGFTSFNYQMPGNLDKKIFDDLRILLTSCYVCFYYIKQQERKGAIVLTL